MRTSNPSPSAQDKSVYAKYLEFGALVDGGRITPNWMPDGNSFWYADTVDGSQRISVVDCALGVSSTLFDVARLRKVVRDKLGHEPLRAGVPFDQFTFMDEGHIAFALEGVRYELNLHDYSLRRPLPSSTYSESNLVVSEVDRTRPRMFWRWQFIVTGHQEQSPWAVSPDGVWAAGIDQNNLSFCSSVDGQTSLATTDGTNESFWDIDATGCVPWSPNGQWLAVLKQNTKGMPRIPIFEWLRPWENSREVIAMPAGGKLPITELYIFDVNSRTPLAVDLGDLSNSYLRILTWTADSGSLIVAVYDRVFSRVEIKIVGVRDASVRTLLSESSPTFVTNHHRALWSANPGFLLLANDAGFIWHSERSGWEHLYLYGLDGSFVRQLTSGDWRVKEIVRVDPAAGWVYFTGHRDINRPYDTHLYRVALNGSHPVQLTEGIGQHAVHLSPNGQYFTDTYSSVGVPPKTVLRSCDGKMISQLDEADISRLEVVGWVPPEEHVVKAADEQTDLWATIYFPYNFDPKKKYPVIEHIYGGPQAIWRPLEFGDQANSPAHRTANFNYALAQLGFIVIILDGRGTPGRSKKFHDTFFKNWGQFEIADHAAAIRQLAGRLPFLDIERVGIWGLSWGGQYAVRAMAQAPDIYKVGVSEVPALDPRRMPLYEPYIGLPQDDPAAYQVADALNLAGNIKGDLLLIAGMSDALTPADMLKMSEKLVRLGTQHRTMVFANSGHVAAAGTTAEYNMDLKKNFFLENLMGGGNE